MTNFAWGNPITGVREVAPTLEEARCLVWNELQDGKAEPLTEIFEQERVGSVNLTGSTLLTSEKWEGGYAFAAPNNGKRLAFEEWPFTVAAIIFRLREMEDPPEEVIVYRQRLAETVNSDDAEPPAPPEEMMSAYRVPHPDTPGSLIQQVLDGTCYDLQRAQILAMLWIAEALHDLGEPKRARRWVLCHILALWLMVFLLIFFRH